ncbi:MAG: 3-deoxy-D-manno-octulosonic acid transferase [Alistipes sp.]|nr:3-deoxy-D-manno-octulosonic acid transferase [Alistipes sp.]
MKGLYNIAIHLYTAAITIAAAVNPKARLWIKGRRGLMERIEKQISERSTRPRVWFHIASLGEFEQARPIIEQLREQRGDIEIIITFFSPSGYEIRKSYPLADAIFYLPADTPKNARRLIKAINPDVAVFIKYEFWLNYLAELRRCNIPTLLVSAIFRRESIFFHPWGKIWRDALATFSNIFVQNDNSKLLLKELGIERVTVAGDTRFDRVRAIAHEAREIAFIKEFRGLNPLLVAGSTWRRDEELITTLANDNPEIKFVIAPHEIEDSHIEDIVKRCSGGAIRYTQCDTTTPVADYQVIILDTMGMLSATYRYATWAYVGGGFGTGIHNILEPAVYGLPIVFGPRYQKFNEAVEMVGRGIARSISNYAELSEWFAPLRDNATLWQQLHNASLTYTSSNCGATERICEAILK